MMTFLLFAPASTKWLGWRKDRKSGRDRSGRFCEIYCVVILRYSFALRAVSMTFCGAVVLNVMDQKTLVKRRWSYKVRITVYIITLGEFARHEFTNLWLETLPDTLSLSLWPGYDSSPNKQDEWINGYLMTSRTMDDYRNSPTIKFCTDLFPAHRCPSAIKFKED